MLAPKMIANIFNSEKTDTFENSKSMNNTKNSANYFNGFMLSEVETDISFQYDAEEVMNTIQDNI